MPAIAGQPKTALADTPECRQFIGKYIEVYEYPDGRIEPRADGRALPYATYYRLSGVRSGAVVDNKRLSHVLQTAQLVQQQRDSRHGSSAPSRNHRGLGPVPAKPESGKKSQRSLASDDIALAIKQQAVPEARNLPTEPVA